MNLNRRLNRLETALSQPGQNVSVWDLLFYGTSVPEDFDPVRDLHPRHQPMWHALVTLPKWLEKEGYANALEALEAGETGPEGLGELFREQAAYEEKDRAWKRIEDALAAGHCQEIPARLLGTTRMKHRG